MCLSDPRNSLFLKGFCVKVDCGPLTGNSDIAGQTRLSWFFTKRKYNRAELVATTRHPLLGSHTLKMDLLDMIVVGAGNAAMCAALAAGI